ncbi:MAG: response regulator [Sedimentisphaerales bacterium]|nr:response regulator [Sedimentisphaerales bacterium]
MEKILIMDDCDNFRALVGDVLVEAGYEVLEAADGNEGLQLYHRNPVSIVIIDMLMPIKDGLETIMELRKLPSRAKIIAVSGGGRIPPTEYLDMARISGVDYTFTKPIDPNVLLSTIRQILDNEKEHASF